MPSKKRLSAAKAKRRPASQKAVIIILVTVIVSMLVFLIIGGIKVYQVISPPRKVVDVQLTSHTKTPSEYSDSVSYYVLGLLGEEVTDPTETLSILCWDKKKSTLNILELPQDTYLGQSGQWAVKRAADVWGNPKPLDWCRTCRRRAEKDEIENGKHSVCNTAITQAEGSASEDLCDVFNDILGLPVDGYFLFQQQSLIKLVNLLGGIDVDLESAISVNDIDYKKGVNTLDGSAALYYVTNRKSGISGDIDRIVRSRKVFIAVFQRLKRQSKASLTNDYIGPLMNGSTPIKTDFSRTEIVELIAGMNNLEPSSVTAYVLPGRTGKAGGKTYFAPHKSSLLALLNKSFNPYGDEITADKLGVTELGSGAASDTRSQTLSEIVIQQSGFVTTTATSTETTAGG